MYLFMYVYMYIYKLYIYINATGHVLRVLGDVERSPHGVRVCAATSAKYMYKYINS